MCETGDIPFYCSVNDPFRFMFTHKTPVCGNKQALIVWAEHWARAENSRNDGGASIILMQTFETRTLLRIDVPATNQDILRCPPSQKE